MINAEKLECFQSASESGAVISCELPSGLPFWLEAIGPSFTALASIAALISLVVLILDSKRRSRPYIEAKLEVGFWGDGSADLILANTGSTPAREISVSCQELDNATSGTATELKRYFAKNRILRPGERIRLIWNHQPEGIRTENGKLVNPLNDIPEVASLNISYRRQKINGKPTKLVNPYTETFHLDASFKAVAPSVAGLHNREDKDMTPNHKDLRRGFELIARQIGELRR